MVIKLDWVTLKIIDWTNIHLFNFSISAVSTFASLMVPWLKKNMGFSFLFSGVIKMLLMMAYLGYLILVLRKDDSFILQFVGVYFVYLFLDAKEAIKLLSSNTKNQI